MFTILQNFNEMWRHTNLVQRVLVLSILLACVGAAAVVVAWVSQPEYALLFADLPPEEAAKAAEKARDDGIPFKLTNGGTTIYVASEHVQSMRMKMIGQGLVQGGHRGYSIIDNTGIGADPGTRKINHIRAIEGELAKSVESLDAIKSARVHIVPAQSKLFAGGKDQASATVVVIIRSGSRLLSHNVAAIQSLIAGGVEGLDAGKVTVVDQKGNKLSDDGETAIARGARGVLNHKIQAELYLARKVEEMLTAALGPGKAKVQVSADVDTKGIEEETETPIEGVAISESTVSKLPVGTVGKITGVEETTSKFEYNTGMIRTKTISLPGTISNIKVACFVDLSKPVKEGEESGSGGKIMETNDVKEMIQNALGLKDISGVTVTETTFYDAAAAMKKMQSEEGDAPMFTTALILDLAKRLSLGVLVIGVLLALKIVRKAPKAPSGEQTAIEGAPQTDNLLTSNAASGMNSDAMRQHITRALKDNPEEVKRLFLSWASNEQENG